MKRLILALLTGAAFAASSPAYAAVKTIVLVHGAFADGSGWKPVADILQNHGYSVRVVQEPETSFAADVAATRRVLDKAGPCVLVGHSYGGMIITETGMHPDVKGLVYVAAMQPDVGESLSDLAGKMPAAAKSIGPVGDGFLAVNPDAFPNDFAADVASTVWMSALSQRCHDRYLHGQGKAPGNAGSQACSWCQSLAEGPRWTREPPRPTVCQCGDKRNLSDDGQWRCRTAAR